MNAWILRCCWLLAGLLAVRPALAELPDFTALVEKVSPAVVNISARGSGPDRAHPAIDPEEMPEWFRRFFGAPLPQGPEMPSERISMGTGFFISADGYLITNHHVVDGADEIYVRLTDRRELKARLVGSDAQTDIAVLKVEGKGFPYLKLGNSRSLKPGQWVVAIGSPFGFENSVTAGIVSAVGRASFDPSQQYVPFIQTDVAINRGNSGGPLLNTDGEVVGVNSQIYSNTGGFMGVSFSIPVEIAMRSANQLREKGYVSRGLLGVNIQEVTRDAARALGMERPMGAAVTGFSENSGARKAGIEVGDVIIAFNGQEIRSASDLPPLVGLTEPGSKARVTVIRDGKQREFEVVIGEAPRAEGGRSGAAAGAEAGALGIVVEDLSDEQRQALGLDDGQGVLVRRVDPAVAMRSGLRGGDVILMVGRNRVDSAARFAELTRDLPEGEPVLLLVRRGEATQFITVTPGKR
ncbi:MAG: peptidase S1 [Lysobacteraceae bacterium]|nr:MAG: peptidase S1 [Xanthomonadaceae bacterium]